MSHTLFLTMVDVECCQCHVIFSVTEDFSERYQRSHKEFYCPAGHKQHWPEKSDIEEAEAEAKRYKERYNRERVEREFHERSARAFKGKVTKIKNRIGNGVCPCCNRHFKNLQRHMTGQHPDYTEKVKT